MNWFGKKVGILGGGQLARMLVQEGQKLGLEMHVLSPLASDPAAQVTRFWREGRLENVAQVKAFAKSVDVLTFESEFISEKILAGLAESANDELKIHPSPKLIRELSDRLSQKNWLESHGVATSPFTELGQKSDAYRFMNGLNGKGRKKRHLTRGEAVVFKRRKFGYDGYGTFITHTQDEVESWLSEHDREIKNFIIERFLRFKRELAIQIAINARGETYIMPLVEWRAENAKCLWVNGPVMSRRVQPLIKKLVKALRESAYVGVFTAEIFETREGFFVNEIAPRVHNSGHYSLEALSVNQFSAHLRAILNLPLPARPVIHTGGFAMLNLIGVAAVPPCDRGVLHWYGKSEARAGRKMGHVTVLNESPKGALREVLALRKKWTIPTEEP